MNLFVQPTRYLFFTGKGGVGKTSMACATAVQLADQGQRVLLVSTDPASNLDEVLGATLQNRPTALAHVPLLSAMNLDPEKSAAAYRERMIGPYRGLLPEAAVKSMEEQFSGACTLEIAAFDEFARLLGDPLATAQFDICIFDTAPTGHTLRLLTLPSAWEGFMAHNTTGTSCLGPLAGLQAQQQLYHDTVKTLSDPQLTTLVLVTRAEPAALREAARTSGELAELGITHQRLVINGLFRAQDLNDPYALALERRGETALASMPNQLTNLSKIIVPLSPQGIVGLDALRELSPVDADWPVRQSSLEELNSECHVSDATEPARIINAAQPPVHLPSPDCLSTLIDQLTVHGHGVILTMGKGGVGKTTIAAAIAVALAQRGQAVHLSTTDPAAHLAATLDGDHLPNLTLSCIDPKVETARYAAEVLRKAGANLDASGRALLEEDLRSPCTEEIAVFRAFADAVAAGTDKFVVLDTAPTGHTILLLDSALAYHREVTRQSSDMPEAVSQLLPRLRDPDFTRILIVTLPEATPVHEAGALQRDLRRAEIEPFAWVINQALSPLPLTDPILKQRQLNEQKFIHEVQQQHATRSCMVAWQMEPPIGLSKLNQLSNPTQLTA